jgi:hypothetical protein
MEMTLQEIRIIATGPCITKKTYNTKPKVKGNKDKQ